jgi:hypothetical protein
MAEILYIIGISIASLIGMMPYGKFREFSGFPKTFFFKTSRNSFRLSRAINCRSMGPPKNATILGYLMVSPTAMIYRGTHPAEEGGTRSRSQVSVQQYPNGRPRYNLPKQEYP